jgi:hypothetical protein
MVVAKMFKKIMASHWYQPRNRPADVGRRNRNCAHPTRHTY